MLAVTYWNFRLMIGMGAVSAAVAAYALWSTRKGRMPVSRIGVYGSLLAVGAPFLANASGWIFTEMGRQPFVVYPNPDVPVGEQVYFFTAQAVSPGITAAEVLDLPDRPDRRLRRARRGRALADRPVRPPRRHHRRRRTRCPAPAGGHPDDDDRAGRRDDVLSFAY